MGSLSLSGSSGTVEAQSLSVPGLAVVQSLSSAQPRNLLEVTATDVAGNASSLSFGILVDTTLPSIAILSPSSGALLNARNPVLVLTYSDALSDIDPASLVVEVDGAPVAISGGGGPRRRRSLSRLWRTPPKLRRGSRIGPGTCLRRLPSVSKSTRPRPAW